ncbi:asparagine synthase (glutamine-hydrolyzing) [Altererythrobacter sp. BO-6]|uniref:asparagine synthase (glutamine-hydrolyzing) n=1 Tax=Altererythrobacter sp. BO-6 TaxID=2604537 RepID=UPI0013E16727|nr:asparagine synthase (glutamine-hydrolyzing) [Altererythrobacter sp. BO-6]QIG54270.1 asparagine synthase (glutamine-hydrolyzing) [Altererythrobacter sp. BO-6]
MCGIVGSISRSNSESFALAVDAMKHRGPDAAVIEHWELEGWRVSLGHRRLSILDLSEAANQPFTSECGNFTLIFNGEIYNHNDLRELLTAKGNRFRTRSDTEVLLAGLIYEGISFLAKANGMFAVALLDRRNRRLLLARDPFGIKPLYVSRNDDGGLIFASEMQALALAAGVTLVPDEAVFSEFLLNGFVYEPSSGFRGVEKVPPGSVVEFSLADAQVHHRRFYNPLTAPPKRESLDTLLTRQIGLEIEADVPVGVFFSGGIDSSVLVAACPRDLEAFFVDYGDEQIGDLQYAEAIAAKFKVPLKRVHHRSETLTADGIIEEFREVARGTEEPISDYTYLATRAISRLAREAGYKVMLSGMGGDELFAGYPRHAVAKYWHALRLAGRGLGVGAELLKRLPRLSKRAGRLKAYLGAPDFAQAYTALVGYFSAEEVSQMTGSHQGVEDAFDRIRTLLSPVRERSALRQAMYLDRFGFLAHNLTVTDRASMAESIEVRVPLLNAAAEAFVWGETDRELVRGLSGKLPLKAYLERHLPKQLIYRPKVGFNPPLDGRIAKIGKDRCVDLITKGRIANVVDPSVTRPWVFEHFEGRANNTYRLWQLIYFSLWLDEWQR